MSHPSQASSALTSLPSQYGRLDSSSRNAPRREPRRLGHTATYVDMQETQSTLRYRQMQSSGPSSFERLNSDPYGRSTSSGDTYGSQSDYQTDQYHGSQTPHASRNGSGSSASSSGRYQVSCAIKSNMVDRKATVFRSPDSGTVVDGDLVDVPFASATWGQQPRALWPYHAEQSCGLR